MLDGEGKLWIQDYPYATDGLELWREMEASWQPARVEGVRAAHKRLVGPAPAAPAGPPRVVQPPLFSAGRPLPGCTSAGKNGIPRVGPQA